MIAHDHLLSGWFDAHSWAKYGLDVMAVIGICGGGWLLQRRRRRLKLSAAD